MGRHRPELYPTNSVEISHCQAKNGTERHGPTRRGRFFWDWATIGTPLYIHP